MKSDGEREEKKRGKRWENAIRASGVVVAKVPTAEVIIIHHYPVSAKHCNPYFIFCWFFVAGQRVVTGLRLQAQRARPTTATDSFRDATTSRKDATRLDRECVSHLQCLVMIFPAGIKEIGARKYMRKFLHRFANNKELHIYLTYCRGTFVYFFFFFLKQKSTAQRRFISRSRTVRIIL